MTTTHDLSPTPEMVEILGQAFSGFYAMPAGTDWNEREAAVYQSLSRALRLLSRSEPTRQDVYLGGDLIRPYLSVQLESYLWLVHPRHDGLSVPRLLTEIDIVRGNTAESLWVSGQGYLVKSIPIRESLARRLSVPKVYLLTLTNLSRYQTRRYPLNIGRLAQWLRFQHAGRVRALDLALNFGGDLSALSSDILSYNPDVLGISLNFGEMNTLRTIMATIRSSHIRPVICVGNVLAAWAAEEVKEICLGFRLFISYSYGERDLENICISGEREHLEERQFDNHAEGGGHIGPSAIILPDEYLLVETLRQKGQASIETSFGCQYGKCTFCPRDHRGNGWRRTTPTDAHAVIGKMSTMISSLADEGSGVLSIVDEDALGQEGMDPECENPSVFDLLKRAGSAGVHCEIYTRLEQIFHWRRSELGSKRRLRQLLGVKPLLTRVFVGLESGSDSQLRRYGKGQTIREAIDALRAGSLLGLPLEFGFITFDPLLTQSEFIENLEFLARTDVLPRIPESGVSIEEVYALVREQGSSLLQGNPVFTRIAYMATELELFVNSPFLRLISQNHRHLLDEYDSTFARYSYHYEDPVIGRIAAWCRVWTEGTFKLIYRMRLAARTHGDVSGPYQLTVSRYREATFGLLVNLMGLFAPSWLPRLKVLLDVVDPSLPLNWETHDFQIEYLDKLWQWVYSIPMVGDKFSERVEFTGANLERRRYE